MISYTRKIIAQKFLETICESRKQDEYELRVARVVHVDILTDLTGKVFYELDAKLRELKFGDTVDRNGRRILTSYCLHLSLQMFRAT